MPYNTGKLVYQWLRQYDRLTGLPTGLRKPNDPGDTDYVAPIDNFGACPLPVTWEPTDPYCIVDAMVCPTGFVPADMGRICIKLEETPATPPTGTGAFKVVEVTHGAYSIGGARIYRDGYTPDGKGAYDPIPVANEYWRNRLGNKIDGPLNRCGVWGDSDNNGRPDSISGEWIGFVAVVELPVDEDVYVGIAGDNAARITLTNMAVTNQTLVQQQYNNTPSENFNYWHIYKVRLKAGPNYIKLEGIDDGSTSASFGAEIYRNTAEQIRNATRNNDLNILYSTRAARGGTFQTGLSGGFSCPPGYTLNPNNGHPVCQKITTVDTIGSNSGMKGYAGRRRLVNFIPDGFTEPNTENTGLGTYFPPVEDKDTCPIPVTELKPFDYCVVRYKWLDDAGGDLDTFTGYINTLTPIDEGWVGFGQNGSYPQLPRNVDPAESYLLWASDNTGSGVEAVLLSFKNFIRDYPVTANEIQVKLNAAWYREVKNGKVDIELTTYLGGTMAKSGYDFQNTGGIIVDSITLPTVVEIRSNSAKIEDSDNVALVVYNKTTKQATIQLV
ncbi:hypothetical protein ACTJJ0_30785 [Chitinophaga sp. 22321]|uniref:Uncharacterized protein n=1 Tax=Chitinophaga hostae TaxID=2831022 RepID=A0ABS5JB02_9BACT|nr:hypothetical protein [Chitinophaga hostae]MBS0031617.1 hypothetical protein [Chitinophaga hostae]